MLGVGRLELERRSILDRVGCEDFVPWTVLSLLLFKRPQRRRYSGAGVGNLI